MAEVFISQTRAAIVDENWPPKPGEPVRVDVPQQFVPAPTPILNSDSAVIMRNPLSEEKRPENAPAPVSIGSVEATFVPTFQPVSNQNGPGVIYGEGPTERLVNLPPPPPPVATNQEVRFTPGPAPIENNDRATIHNSRSLPIIPIVAQAPPAPATNESPASFIPGRAGGAIYSGDTYIPQRAQEVPAPKSDVINVGGSDVQILPGSQTMNVSGDRTFGGGGDTTRMAGTEDISFLGKNSLNVGSSDIFQAPSAQQSHAPNSEDHVFTPSRAMMGNQETVTGAVGDPTANQDHGQARFGEWGLGKPKNVKG